MVITNILGVSFLTAFCNQHFRWLFRGDVEYVVRGLLRLFITVVSVSLYHVSTKYIVVILTFPTWMGKVL